MESKRKKMLMRQMAYYEHELQERQSFLSGREIPSPKPDKDTLVRKLRAKIKAMKKRLRPIDDNEKKMEEIAKIKAEKAIALQKEKETGKGEKPKKAPPEAKGKKIKGEKKPAPSKAPEGDKSQKPAESSEEGKPTKKKKGEETREEPASPAKADK